MKTITGFFLAMMLSMSSLAQVPERVYTMQNLESHYKEFKASQDKYQALNALFSMNNAVLDLIEFLPESLNQLKDDDPKVVEYRRTLNELLTEINKAKKLFVDNKFEEGKQVIKQIDEIKARGHQKFKSK